MTIHSLNKKKKQTYAWTFTHKEFVVCICNSSHGRVETIFSQLTCAQNSDHVQNTKLQMNEYRLELHICVQCWISIDEFEKKIRLNDFVYHSYEFHWSSFFIVVIQLQLHQIRRYVTTACLYIYKWNEYIAVGYTVCINTYIHDYTRLMHSDVMLCHAYICFCFQVNKKSCSLNYWNHTRNKHGLFTIYYSLSLVQLKWIYL